MFDCPGCTQTVTQFIASPVVCGVGIFVTLKFLITESQCARVRGCGGNYSQTPAADHQLQRASHRGHLTDPDKEPTAAIGCSLSV
jgi:hypothetical protein